MKHTTGLVSLLFALLLATPANSQPFKMGDMGKRPTVKSMTWKEYLADTIGDKDGTASSPELAHYNAGVEVVKISGNKSFFLPGAFCVYTDDKEEPFDFFPTSDTLYPTFESARDEGRKRFTGGQIMEFGLDGTPKRLYHLTADGTLHKKFEVNSKPSPPARDIRDRLLGFPGYSLMEAFVSTICVNNPYNPLPETRQDPNS
jgi:hypothetical protein